MMKFREILSTVIKAVAVVLSTFEKVNSCRCLEALKYCTINLLNLKGFIHVGA